MIVAFQQLPRRAPRDHASAEWGRRAANRRGTVRGQMKQRKGGPERETSDGYVRKTIGKAVFAKAVHSI